MIKIALSCDLKLVKSMLGSFKKLAKANTVAALANSAGCKLKLPKLYQEVAPFIVDPKTNNPTKESIEIT